MSLPRLLLALAVAGLALFAPPALAVDAPRQMTFQGRLMRADGSPETLPQDLHFALYATPSGGAPLWEETRLSTPVSNGYYAVVLGTSTPLPAAVVNGQALYLGVSLVGQSELTPRLTVASVPYALLANDSNALQGRPASSFADAAHTHDSVPRADDSNRLQGQPASAFAPSAHTHAPASPTANGFMASTDKAKLNGLPSTFGAGLNFTSSTVSVNFGSSGSATTAARSDHTHPSPALSCTYRTATGNIDTNKNSTAWCAAGEILTGGGCSDLNGTSTVPGVTFGPTGVTTVDGSTPTSGPAYTCRLPNPPTGTSIPTAYAICCRIP
jgi:hypothetical protein